MKYLIVFLLSVVCSQAQFLSGGRGGAGGSGSSAAAIPATIYYVATNGNNSTAVPGDATKPYGTVAAAFTAVVNNSTIYLMPGNHTVTPYNIYDADGDTLATAATANLITKTNILIRGPGANIYGTGQGSLSFIKNCSDITFDTVGFLGNWPTTNAVANTTNYAHVFFVGGNDYIKFEKCTFDSFGMYGIGSLGNTSLSANDNILNVEVVDSLFRNGGATNVSGAVYTIGGAVFAKCRNFTMRDSRVSSLSDGLYYLQQYKRGSTVSENVYCTLVNNSINDIKNSLLQLPVTAAANGFTNECYVTMTANVCNNVGQDSPNGVGSSLGPVLLDFRSGNVYNVTANSFINYSNVANTTCANIASTVSRVSGLIANNTFRGFGYGVIASTIAAGNDVDGFSILNNSFDGVYGQALLVGGRSISVRNNRLTSVCTNSSFSSSGQIGITGSFTLGLSTNIVVADNIFTDLVVGSPGNSTVFAASTNSYQVHFLDNVLNTRLASVTNSLINHNGTGTIRQKYTAQTTTATPYPVQYFTTQSGAIVSMDYRIQATCSSITGTNVGCMYIQRNGFKTGGTGSWALGSGVATDLTLEDGPLANCAVTSGVVGSFARQGYVQVTGTNSTTIDWILDMNMIITK